MIVPLFVFGVPLDVLLQYERRASYAAMCAEEMAWGPWLSTLTSARSELRTWLIAPP